MAFYAFPGTNFNDLNLDWVLEQIKAVVQANAEMQTNYEGWKQIVDTAIEDLYHHFDNVDEDVKAQVDGLFALYSGSDEFAEFLVTALKNDTGEGNLEDIIDTWLANNLDTTQGYPLDPDLNLTQAAAPAKIVGDFQREERPKIDSVFDEFFTVASFNLGTRTSQTYWDCEDLGVGDTATLTAISATYYTYEADVTAGQMLRIDNMTVSSTAKARTWLLTDNDHVIVQMPPSEAGQTAHTVYIYVPTGATKLLITKYGASHPDAYLYTSKFLGIEKPLAGLRFSLLGDSISALAGHIPDGYHSYYSGSNHGISNVSQMWYSVLQEATGMIPLVINADSGSAVTQLDDAQHSNRIPMSSDERTSNLGTNDYNPDIVIIEGGTNDFTYAASAKNEPLEWNGTDAATLGDSFTEAYACMIKKIQTNYPGAIVVCLSTCFTMRGTDNGYTCTHSVGSNVYTQSDYNNAIKRVCEMMRVPYLDIYNCGFNRANYYPTFAQDSADTPTHPNAAGHKVMGMTIAAKILELVKGFSLNNEYVYP